MTSNFPQRILEQFGGRFLYHYGHFFEGFYPFTHTNVFNTTQNFHHTNALVTKIEVKKMTLFMKLEAFKR